MCILITELNIMTELKIKQYETLDNMCKIVSNMY